MWRDGEGRQTGTNTDDVSGKVDCETGEDIETAGEKDFQPNTNLLIPLDSCLLTDMSHFELYNSTCHQRSDCLLTTP